MIVLVPKSSEDEGIALYQRYQRDVGVHYLATTAASHMGEFVIAYLENGSTLVYVHTKLMIVDDEFIVIGSANVTQRSMTHDGELQLGIVDGQNQLARSLRESLWEEHLKATIPPDVDDAFSLFKERVAGSLGNVRPYPTGHPGTARREHGRMIKHIIDPYAGPPR